MKQLMWILLAVCGLSFSSAANATPGDVLIARENGVAVYDAPSSAAQVVITLDEGRRLKELTREGPWIKVIIYGELGKDGWVHGSRVAPEGAGTKLAAQPGVSADTLEEQAAISPGPQFVLVITGTPQQPFRARCQTVDREGARKTVRLEGRLPNTYELEGNAVRCRVQRLSRYAGALGVTLYRQGRSRPLGAAQTNATNGCISVRSKAHWGRAWGKARCSRSASY